MLQPTQRLSLFVEGKVGEEVDLRDFRNRWVHNKIRCSAPKVEFAQQKDGGEGYRSLCLSHAKRSLYHLSYTPSFVVLLANYI